MDVMRRFPQVPLGDMCHSEFEQRCRYLSGPLRVPIAFRSAASSISFECVNRNRTATLSHVKIENGGWYHLHHH